MPPPRFAKVDLPTLAPMSTLRALLPAGVTFVEHDGSGPAPPLHPCEAALAASEALARQREFAHGRACARAALAELGWAGGPIGRDANRAPVWPAGFVGSITHTDGYVAAIAARAGAYSQLGVDAERIGAVEPAIWNLLFTDRERAGLETLPCNQRAATSTALFSAKESYFKAVHPLRQAWIDFLDMEVSLDGARWTARPTRATTDLPPQTGRLIIGSDLVITCLCIDG